MQTGIIEFQGNELLTVRDEANGKIYVAMKPIVDGMGLEWSRQSKKIKEDSRFNCGLMYMVGADGKKREMLSIDLGHLPAFLYSINPNKVRADLKDKILAFQQETFNVINNYWNNKFTVKTGTSQEFSTILFEKMVKSLEVLVKSNEALVQTNAKIVEKIELNTSIDSVSQKQPLSNQGRVCNPWRK